MVNKVLTLGPRTDGNIASTNAKTGGGREEPANSRQPISPDVLVLFRALLSAPSTYAARYTHVGAMLL